MVIIVTSLSELRTWADLAVAICVPVPELDTVSLAPVSCRQPGCPLSLAQGNHGRCILCQQSWFLREFDKNGQVVKYRRGYGLYGPQFLCKLGGKTSSCCCTTPLCEKLGYS